MGDPEAVGHDWDFMRDDDDEGNEAYDVNHWQCSKCLIVVPVSWEKAPSPFLPNRPGPGFTPEGTYLPRHVQTCEEIQVWRIQNSQAMPGSMMCIEIKMSV